MQTDLSKSPVVEAIKLFEAGRLQEADRACREILARTPRDADALHLLGLLAIHAGHPNDAVTLFDLAIAQRPGFAAAHANRGMALMGLGRGNEGVEGFLRSVELRPDHANTWHALGNALATITDLEGAEKAYRQALQLDPRFIEARSNLALALRHQGRVEEAIDNFQEALKLAPDQVAVHYELGVALHLSGRIEDAAVCYRRVLTLDPGHALAASALLLATNYLPDLTANQVLDAHRAYDVGHARALAPASSSPANDRDPERRLRIGYVSGDLCSHPVGYYLVGPLAAHDHKAFEVVCYSNSPREDEVTARLKASSDDWRPISGLTDEAAADLIRKDRIDILVDLSGHADRNRPLLFARKPAPIQVSWLGYPGTTGLSAIDYAVMDPSMTPPGAEAWFSEPLVRLPHGRLCYSPPTYAPDVGDPGERPGGAVVFGSFNNLAKIGPQVVRLWARVLDAVPGSRLILKWPELGQPGLRQRVFKAFAAAGVGEDRLELRGASLHPQMLAEYADIDIALDPFPFGGGLTSCEALWMGVPVVTLPQDRPTSRQTLAFLHELGLDELAAGSEDDYVRIAAALAADPARRADLRQTLRPRMAASPLTDAKAFTPGLEAAYRQMWRRWCADEFPAAIAIQG